MLVLGVQPVEFLFLEKNGIIQFMGQHVVFKEPNGLSHSRR